MRRALIECGEPMLPGCSDLAERRNRKPMKTAILAPLMLLFGFVMSCVAHAESADAYRLRPGDTVLIQVWRESALEREVRVLPDGSITFPLAGRLRAAGLTAPEVERQVREKLKQFIADPEVTVVVTGIDGNRVYVLGKVVSPGPVVLTGPMTVLQALSIAGGLDKFADGNSIRILRPTGQGEELLPVRYDDLLNGRRVETNVQLKAGDTILVP